MLYKLFQHGLEPVLIQQILFGFKAILKRYRLFQILYWGTAKWSPVEIFECISLARSINCIGPICEYAEYHPFHREKVHFGIILFYKVVLLPLVCPFIHKAHIETTIESYIKVI